tara:strand:+ start:1042 stop:1668 length:627 start_codon:yes stop_codon:yes gene_type:complete
MKSFNQFITELNKFELAMKTGKLGLKSLKRIQGRVNKHLQPWAHFKIGNKRKVPVDTIQKLRNRPYNSSFGSIKRSQENAVADAITTGKTSALTKFRHEKLRGLSKAKVREKDAVAQVKKLVDDRPKDQDIIIKRLKNTGDQNRLINKFDDINVEPYYSPYDSGVRPLRKGNPNFTKQGTQGDYSKFGGQPTTRNIKKGSIPEPKKKK